MSVEPVLALARPAIVALASYEPARWDPALERLHANENPWRADGDRSLAGLNRYPDPLHVELDERLAALYAVPSEALVAARGSDEVLDLLTRVFCEAGRDAVLICPPTFAMYETVARIQGAAVHRVPLRPDFQLDVAALEAALRPEVKLVFLCSPNNPTGNSLATPDVERILEVCRGRALVVLDEAYVEFSGLPSWSQRLAEFPHLCVVRTCSKAYALAGARVGSLLAHPEVARLVRKVLPPYAIAQPSIDACLAALGVDALDAAHRRIGMLRAGAAHLSGVLRASPCARYVWPTDANFVLVDCHDPDRVLARAAAAGLLVRDVRRPGPLASSLRISVGTPQQIERLARSLA